MEEVLYRSLDEGKKEVFHRTLGGVGAGIP